VSGFSNPLVGGGGALVYPSIHSPNFSQGPPITGWSINKDGSAFFSGTVGGSSYELNANGFFLYFGTPALGNLVASITSISANDEYGNAYYAGINTYVSGGSTINMWRGVLAFLDPSGNLQDAYIELAGNAGANTQRLIAAIGTATLLTMYPGTGQAGIPANGAITTSAPLYGMPQGGLPGVIETPHSMAGGGLNSFVVSGADYQFVPINQGGISFRGIITMPGGTLPYNGVTFFQMPVGYRPQAVRRWPVSNSTGLTATGYCVLNPDGTMALQGIPSGYNSNAVDITNGLVPF
jgi:hypothetical protein